MISNAWGILTTFWNSFFACSMWPRQKRHFFNSSGNQ